MENREALIRTWKKEEQEARIHGWDFSHINDRYCEEEDIPWDYRQVIDTYRKPEMELLDIDTGGGEFLLSLGHPAHKTTVTEGYGPNIALCKEIFGSLGVRFRAMQDVSAMPFAPGSFEMIINRHGSYDPRELYRTLKPGGLFITQQVGERNDRELVERLLPEAQIPYPGHDLLHQKAAFIHEGFEVLEAMEHFGHIRFYDVGALVWFARIIEWEFPGFSVDACLPQLLDAQKELAEKGSIEGRTHRFLLVCRKPGKTQLSYERIYEAVRQIPKGKVSTYGQIAALAGNERGARVVGNALHLNPDGEKTPCYRVVNGKGYPAEAFVFGGVNVQIERLKADGVEFVNGHVDMKKYLWNPYGEMCDLQENK